MQYQINPSAAGPTIHVPVKLAKRLGLRPNAPLSHDKLGDLREALGLPRAWPRGIPEIRFHFSSKGD